MRIRVNIIITLLILLIVPNITFLVFWYKWYVFVSAIILITYLLKKLGLEFSKGFKNDSIKLISLTIIISVILTMLSGTCNFFSQNFDFIKHHLITCDLVNNKWPIVYRDSNYLSYNIAYYIIPAGIAKLTSKSIAEYLIFIQLAFTLFISFRYIQLYVTKNALHSFLIILIPNSFLLLRALFSIMGVEGFNNIFDLNFLGQNYLFLKPVYLEVSTFMTQLMYVPQHLSALLIAGCLMHYSWKTKNIKLGIIICCFTPLWSVFVAASLALLVFFQVIIYHKKALKDWFFILLSAILSLIFVSYFTGHAPLDINLFWEISFSQKIAIIVCLAGIYIPYILFLIFLNKGEKLVFKKRLTELIKGKDPKIILPLLCFLLVPLFFIFNQFDLMLRSTAVFLFLLNLALISGLYKMRRIYQCLFIAVFLIGGVAQLSYKPIKKIRNIRDWYTVHDYHYYLTNKKTIYDIDSYHANGIKFQYLSDTKESFFYRHLARKGFVIQK